MRFNCVVEKLSYFKWLEGKLQLNVIDWQEKVVDDRPIQDRIILYKVEIFLEQREVAFLSPSKICETLNFSTEIQIFSNFAGC